MILETCDIKVVRGIKHKAGELEDTIYQFLESGNDCNRVKHWSTYYKTTESARSSINRTLTKMKLRDLIGICCTKDKVYIYRKDRLLLNRCQNQPVEKRLEKLNI